MVKSIKVIFVASDDPEFGEVESKAILLAPDLVLEQFSSIANIFLLDSPVTEGQEFIKIDRSTPNRLEVDFLSEDNERLKELGLEFIAGASFIEVLRQFAKK